MKKLIIAATALTACIALVLFARHAQQAMHKAQEDSAQRALFVEFEDLLENYRQQHDRYPATLKELAVTNWPDGSSSDTLSRFEYTSSSTSYTLFCAKSYVQLSAKGPK